MKQRLFIRNVRVREQLEIFVVSAVTSLLLLRFYLYLAGYPQVGGGSLHIAHMLYGGLFMAIAIIMSMSFLGYRLQRLTALIGGVGFGIFIDEIGKFLTKDNNYFFRPAIGIIYAIFVLLYLLTNFLSRRQKHSSQTYQLNALVQLEEAILHNMDEHEKARVAELLRQADPQSPITVHLREFLASVETVPVGKPNIFERFLARADAAYSNVWKLRSSSIIVQSFFSLIVAGSIIILAVTIFQNIDSVRDFFEGKADYGHSLVIGQLASTILVAVFGIVGIARFPKSRQRAFELFRRAALTNLLLTEFFIFSRIQFDAMYGFIANLLLLVAIDIVLSQERRTKDN